MSRKIIEAYNQLMEGMDKRAAAHLVKLGIGKSAKENLKNWKARKDRMKAEVLKNPFTTVAVRHETLYKHLYLILFPLSYPWFIIISPGQNISYP